MLASCGSDNVVRLWAPAWGAPEQEEEGAQASDGLRSGRRPGRGRSGLLSPEQQRLVDENVEEVARRRADVLPPRRTGATWASIAAVSGGGAGVRAAVRAVFNVHGT